MSGLVAFLRCVGRAALKNGGKAIASLVPGGEAAFEIARDACEDFRRDHRGQMDRPLPPCAAGEAGRRLEEGLPIALATDLLHLPGKPAGVVEKAPPILAPDLLHLPDKSAGVAVLAELCRSAEGTTYRKYLPTQSVAEPGFWTLEQVHEQHPALDGRHLGWIFKRLLTVLGFCHRQGRVHAAVLPSHVLIHAGNHGLQLIGWGQSVAVGRPVEDILPRWRDWYPPEVRQNQPATAATDLFLAARCMIYLAGGDPVSGRMPAAIPDRMRRFIATCLFASVSMRPGDAWKLMDEFDELLHKLYGPPRFYPLTMN
jgi:hypothetical protein